jgi:TonB-linked SusC/RagA family outer membrane protein
MQKTTLTIVLAMLCLIFKANGQSTLPIQITGKITDDQAAGLPGATIRIKNTKVITQTNVKGTFMFTTSQSSGILVISFLGYQTKEVPFSGSGNIPTIELSIDENTLNELQVIGYGKTTKRLNTGSISNLGAQQIEQQPVTNVLSALSGRMPGVFVQTTNGLPGGNINIQIRGKGSIQAGTSPLYIIDGIPFDASPIASETSLGYSAISGNVSPLNSINPNDIESISILKDADATAIYGSRGSNGVVLISTKKGKSGAITTDFNLYQGFNQAANLPKMMEMANYFQIRREAFSNDGLTPSADPNSFEYAPDLLVWDTNKSTDWVDYLFGGTGRLTNAQLSLKGGSDQTSFSVSGNYRNEQSYLKGGKNYQRGGIHTQISHNSVDGKFTLSASSSISADNNRMANAQNISLSTLPSPNYPLYDADGNYNWYAGSNLLAEMQAISKIATNNILSNIGLSYKFLPELNLRINTGYNRISIKQTQLYPAASLYPGTPNYTLFGTNVNQSVIVEPQIEYQVPIKRNKLTLMAGATYQYKSGEGSYLEARNFSNEGLMENLASAGFIDGRRSTYIDYKFASLFARATFTLLNKYIFNGTARRDGSSRFASGHQFGNFGAIGIAWLFGSEEWLHTQIPFLSYGKLRASYGITGNDQIPDYQYLSSYGNSGLVYQGISGLQPSRIANANFHWESTKKLEFALELGFFKDKLLVNVNRFLNRSDNQLINYTLPEITGFNSYQANLPAVVENSGWEFEINSKNIQHKDFQWSTTFNLTLPKNRLKSFENFEASSYAKTLQIGYDITRVIGYEFLGVDPQTGTASYVTETTDPASAPDYYRTIGKQTPDFYGGLGNSFTWKRFSLDLFLQFAGQKTVGGIFFTPGWMYGTYQLLEKRWKQPGDITSIPKASTGLDFNYSQSSANFFDSSYLRLKNVNFSYQIPLKGTSTLRIYSQAQNLFTIWDKDAAIIDPESGALSVAQKNLPPVKSLTLGMQLTF